MSDSLEFESEWEFAEFFNELLRYVHEDPLENFIRSPHFLDFDPTPAQSVAIKTVFGQTLDPDTKHDIWKETTEESTGNFDLESEQLTEVELFERMTDSKYDPELQKHRNRINLIVGRRGGKSSVSAMLALFCAIKQNWKPYLHKTPRATVLILSHSVAFSEEILEFIDKFIKESPILSRLIDADDRKTKNRFSLKIPFIEEGEDGEEYIEYSYVRVMVGTASKKTTRGKAICALLCDEVSFWNLDENSAERDEDIIRAVRPSLLQFGDHGLLIKLSSPGIKQGVLYEEYLKRHNLPDSYVTFKAPSWVWNTTLDRTVFKEEFVVDPSGFDSEYRANFVDSISNFILPEFVDFCVNSGVTFREPSPASADIVYCAAIDAAFKGDRFAFTVVGWNGHKYLQYVSKTWKGSSSDPVKAAEVAKYIRTVCNEYGVSRVYADQYSFNPLWEIFDQYSISLMEQTFTNQFKRKIYYNLKNIIHNQKIELLDDVILKGELKQLQAEQTTSGTIKIYHPPSGSDDCADTLATSVYLLSQNVNSMVAGPEIAGSTESDYDIPTDSKGRAFTAPSASMLSDYFGEDVVDNSQNYEYDENGKPILEDQDDDDEGANEGGSEFIFA